VAWLQSIGEIDIHSKLDPVPHREILRGTVECSVGLAKVRK
jgi:hypothetical protein